MGIISKILNLFSGTEEEKGEDLKSGIDKKVKSESQEVNKNLSSESQEVNENKDLSANGVGEKGENQSSFDLGGTDSKSESTEIQTPGAEDGTHPNAKDMSAAEETEEVTVLVVDDESEVADMYGLWMENYEKCGEVRTAYGGEEALEKVDEDVDIVYLDRRMPDISGDEVLEKIRERGIECQVVMVTAVDPDFDIVDMPFDHYLTKPVKSDGLKDTIDKIIERRELDEGKQRQQTLGLKKKILDDHKGEEVEESEEYEKLLGEIEENEKEEGVEGVDDLDDFFS